MNKLFYVIILSIVVLTYGCTKSEQPYSNGVNHAVGMTNSRMWSGTSNGYAIGDTLEGRNLFDWPEHFSRVITDSTFAVVEINGFSIRIGNNVLTYRTTDSVNQMVTFDSLITGTLTATAIYFYAHDSITFNYAAVFGYNDSAAQYYQANTFLHTLPAAK